MTILDMLDEVVGYEAHYEPIDIKIAVESKCESGHAMKYRGFHKENSYRAFCVCEECDIALEF